MVRSFTDLSLSPSMHAAIAAAGYTTPTPIQARAVPPILEGRDVIGCAQTGTGKTAAFAIPVIERLTAGGTNSRPGSPRVLVLSPTRELAVQTAAAFGTLGGAQGIRAVTLIGGEPLGPQVTALAKRPDVLVATPGRLNDHLERRSVSLGGLRVVVLDEADRMLDMGFAPQVERILAVVPLDRQTLCFSATMPPDVERLVRRHLVQPLRIEVGVYARPVERVRQVLYTPRSEDKTRLLLDLLRAETGPTLVFTRTRHRAERLARAVAAAGHRSARLHADRSMAQRRDALEGFRAGRYRVLVATDLAARGLDVVGISHVVNFDLPQTPEDYVHRIGRTARAEASGLASSFAAPEDTDRLRAIERHLGEPVPRGTRAKNPA